MRRSAKIFSYLLYAFGLTLIVSLSNDKYDWMRGMDSTTGAFPVDDGSSGRVIFSFLLLTTISASQLVIALTAPGKMDALENFRTERHRNYIEITMKTLVWLILTAAISLNVFAADDLITDLNRKSANIEDLIRGQKLTALSVCSDEESEGNPPEIRFYTKADKLLAVRITTGHETWVSVITVYFYENGTPMKYLKLVTGREKNPEREAIIYSPEGRVLWKNMEKPQVEIADILRTFHTIRTIRQSASQY